jgi:hypothetical protein
MSGAHALVARSKPAEFYLVRMQAHLACLGTGHDPLGHLFGIERLARAARAEWWVAGREAQRAQNGQARP